MTHPPISGTIEPRVGDNLVGASVSRIEPIWHMVGLSVLRRAVIGTVVVAGLALGHALSFGSAALAQAIEPVQSANLPSITSSTTSLVETLPPPLADPSLQEPAPQELGTPETVEMAPIPDVLPEKRTGPLNVHVFGDSLGDGIWAGLYRKLPKADGYKVTKHSRVSTGLVRKDFYNWSKAVRQIVAKHRVDVAVVMIGTNDRQTIVEGGRHALRSPGWEAIYKARIDDMTQVLKDEGAEVFWVELPAMRSPRFGRDMKYFNTLFEDRAVANGITYVPTWQRTLGSNGKYSAYGLDDKGRKRLMRTNDGIHFTMRGYVKMAGFVTAAMEEAARMEEVVPVVELPVEPVAVSPLIDPITGATITAPVATAPLAPDQPVAPSVDQPDAPDAPGDQSAVSGTPQRSERAGVSEVASTIAGALSDLRGFVLPEPKPGRADDLRQPAE